MKKNNIRRTALLLALAMLLGLTACGRKPADPSPAGPAEPNAGSPTQTESPADGTFQLTGDNYDLVFATNGTGTGNYAVAAAQGSIVTSKTGTVNVTVMATSGPEGIVSAIKAGSAQIGIQSYGSMAMLYGEGVDEAMRAMFCGGVTAFGFVTTEESGIKSVEDLRGRRVTYLSNSKGYVIAAEAILAGNGIDAEKDVTALTMVDAASGLQDLVDGKTDAVISAISGSKMEELASKCNPYVIPVSNVEACSEASDGYYVPYDFQREFPGVTLGQSILGIVSMISVTKDTPAEAVYLYVKTCMESYEELAAVGSDLKDWTPEAAIRTAAGLPYHEGAVIYYKESGMWDDEIDAWQQERLSALGTES